MNENTEHLHALVNTLSQEVGALLTENKQLREDNEILRHRDERWRRIEKLLDKFIG